MMDLIRAVAVWLWILIKAIVGAARDRERNTPVARWFRATEPIHYEFWQHARADGYVMPGLVGESHLTQYIGRERVEQLLRSGVLVDTGRTYKAKPAAMLHTLYRWPEGDRYSTDLGPFTKDHSLCGTERCR